VSFVRPVVEIDGVPFPAFFTQGGVTLEDASGSTMEVQARAVPVRAGREPNHTSGGRPAFVHPEGDEIELLGFPGLYVSARIPEALSRFLEAYLMDQLDLVLGGLVVATDALKVATWPDRLVA
jgi:hypothetical protein